MWRISLLLEDTCVYVGQKITLAGSVRATIGRIFIRERKVTAGYVSAATKTIFRSESAKYNLFIQMAREMWEFDEDGQLYYEKALQGFLPELLKRWKEVPTNHVCSVVLFARVHYEESELHMLEGWPLRKDPQGRTYVDYYKVIVDIQSNCDWPKVMQTLKEEFFRFQHDILLIQRPVAGPSAAQEETHAELLRDHALLAGRLSYSHEGNILEAVNLALNPFDEHYIDRDLNRTGLSIAVVTAGTGRFDVDKQMLRVTTERMIDNGIGLDLVCLTKMPLHSVPLFHFKSHVPDMAYEKGGSGSQKNSSGFQTSRNRRSGSVQPARASTSLTAPDPLYYDEKRQSPDETVSFYSMPHWIDCSFFNMQADKPFRADSFVPRCKMYDIQMMGIMENQIADISIPYLDMKVVRPTTTSSSAGPGTSAGDRQGEDKGTSFVVPVIRSLENSLTSPAQYDYADATVSHKLTPREQRRLAREAFDRAALKDVSPALNSRLTIMHPSQSRLAGGAAPEAMSLGRTSSFDQTDPRGSAPTSTRTPDRRPTIRSALSRTSTVDDRGDEEHLSAKGSAQEVSSPETAAPAPRPLSRVGSVRSMRTLAKGIRPLEPMGKAQALVGTSVLDGAVVATPSILHPEAGPSRLARPGGNKATTSAEKAGYRLSASWLWKSLLGGQATAPKEEVDNENALVSSTAASKRIQQMLGESSRGSTPVKADSIGEHPSKKEVPSSKSDISGAADEDRHAAILIPLTMQRPADAADPDAKLQKQVEDYEQAMEDEDARLRYAQRALVEKQTLVNPSNPSKTIQGSSTQLLRWQHLFPRRLNRHAVKWRSMTSPACLPLTTLHLPSATDLATQWQEYPHTLSISSETQSFLLKRSHNTHPALAVLREMTFQRLAQGFQFIVPATNRGTLNTFSSRLLDPTRFMLRHPSESFQPGIVSSGNPIFLSQSNQIHRIAYDPSSGAINVKRYLRKNSYDVSPIQYECCVWPRNLPGYQNTAATFNYPSATEYSWTYLDSLISGFTEETFIEPLKYWRTRFVLVPTEGRPPAMRAPTGEHLSDEEVRLLGTDKLADLFARARFKRSSSDRQPLRFLPTSLDPTQSVHDEEFMSQLKAINNAARPPASQPPKPRIIGNLTDMSIDELVKEMRSDRGVKIEDRMWHRVLYSDTFVGAELVTWLCHSFFDVGSREEAVEWGAKLQQEGVFEHVRSAHGFLDGHYFVSCRRQCPACFTG